MLQLRSARAAYATAPVVLGGGSGGGGRAALPRSAGDAPRQRMPCGRRHSAQQPVGTPQSAVPPPPPPPPPAAASDSGLRGWERILPAMKRAAPGSNRWLRVPAAVCTHLSLGSVMAWSLLNDPLTKHIGVLASVADDWSLPTVVPVFSTVLFCQVCLSFFVLFLSVAFDSACACVSYVTSATRRALQRRLRASGRSAWAGAPRVWWAGSCLAAASLSVDWRCICTRFPCSSSPTASLVASASACHVRSLRSLSSLAPIQLSFCFCLTCFASVASTLWLC